MLLTSGGDVSGRESKQINADFLPQDDEAVGQAIHVDGEGAGEGLQRIHRIGEVIDTGNSDFSDGRIPDPDQAWVIPLNFLDHTRERYIGNAQAATGPRREIIDIHTMQGTEAIRSS